jgi:Skp family chaperone for outer membrane proteins
MKRTMIWVVVMLLTLTGTLSAQEQAQQRIRCIAFYNLENLLDTIHD